MTEPSTSRPLPDDPRLQAYLPLLYVAWADSELEEDEIRAVCGRIQREAPDRTCEDLLGRWLDPEAPPSAEDLAGLLEAIRSSARGLDPDDRASLSALGTSLARRAGHEPDPAELEALAEVERALGVEPEETSARLVTPERPEPAAGPPRPAFDVAGLEAHLAAPYGELRREVLELLASPDFERPLELERSRYRELALAQCRALGGRGWGALSFPETAGGADDVGRFVAVFETLAHGDLSTLVKFGVQFGLFGGSILHLGTERHHRELLPAVGSLELPGCFAMTETGHGSNVAELRTTATYDPESDELVVHTPGPDARKDYIGNAACHGRMATVFAQLEVGGHRHGVHAVLVPIRDGAGQALPGVEIEDDGPKMGLQGVDNGRLAFDRVRVPRANLLDRFGAIDDQGRYESPIASPTRRFFTMLGTLVGGRVSVALAGLSATKSALAIAVRYAERRRQFGPEGEAEVRLLDYLAHQRRLLPRLAKTYVLHAALRELAASYAEAGGERRELETHAAGLKAMATWHATDTVQECREACGGQGYLAENRFAALKADTDVFTTFEGDNTVLLQLVAKGLLAEYRNQFHDLSPFGMVRWVVARAAGDLAEKNPFLTRRADEDHLRDRDLHLDLLRWREERLLHTLARRLKARLDRGLTAFAALNECQDHALESARAFVDRLALEAYERWAAEAPEPLRELLASVGDLHALATLEAEKGFYLEHGLFDPPKSRAIRTLVNELCRELRPHAGGLVDGFGLGGEVLRAPIAAG
ncbi:MAG: acyl-CoA dehydrogenase [Acidobacteriota bacterium]|jgi:acyl-CoA oxidase